MSSSEFQFRLVSEKNNSDFGYWRVRNIILGCFLWKIIEIIQNSNRFFNGWTTIRRKRTQKVHYNQIEGGLSHCTVFDKNNNQLILNESVLNGGIYKLFRFGEHVFLEPTELKRFYFSASLKSEKYDCNIFGYDCEYRKSYTKLLRNAQGKWKKGFKRYLK